MGRGSETQLQVSKNLNNLIYRFKGWSPPYNISSLSDFITGNEMSVQTSRFANVWFEIKQIWVIFTNLKFMGRGSETQLQEGENLNYLI